MRIVHVASYKDEFFNGIKSVLIELVPEQRKLGYEVFVFNHEKNEREVIPGERYISSNKVFIAAIREINPDLVIFHSLYGLNDVIHSLYLNKVKIPYLIEPHGGTSFENAKKNWLKKKVANVIYVKKFIRNARGIVYLMEKEANECVFQKNRRSFTIIPNGTQIHGRNPEEINMDDKIRFMFLARIDILQKGLDLLFPAIKKFNKKINSDKYEFHFYGKARNLEWLKQFDKFIEEADKNVYYHGPVDGEDKAKAFKNADIFILTSRYEGMPMAVLEALSYGCPCILTPQTNMTDLIARHDAGWITNTDIDNIADILIKASLNFKDNRKKYIANAIETVKPYSWESIAMKSIEEYKRFSRSKL